MLRGVRNMLEGGQPPLNTRLIIHVFDTDSVYITLFLSTEYIYIHRNLPSEPHFSLSYSLSIWNMILVALSTLG